MLKRFKEIIFKKTDNIFLDKRRMDEKNNYNYANNYYWTSLLPR
jgi:hypothetical protein